MHIIIIPGFGSQYVGMGKYWYDQERIIQESFEEAALCSNINFVKLCFASSEIELSRPENAYQVLLLWAVSCARMMHQANISFDAVASVDIPSWYGSLFAAGAITFPDGLYILQKIALLYTEFIAQHTLAVLDIINVKKIKSVLMSKSLFSHLTHEKSNGPFLSLISLNSCQIVGNAKDIVTMKTECDKEFISACSISDFTGGMHGLFFQEIIDRLRDYLAKIDFQKPERIIISPITGKPIPENTDLKEYSEKVMINTIQYDAMVKYIGAEADILTCFLPSAEIKNDFYKSYFKKKKETTQETRLKHLVGLEGIKEWKQLQELFTKGV